MRVVYAAEALNDFGEIGRWIAEDNPIRAKASWTSFETRAKHWRKCLELFRSCPTARIPACDGGRMDVI